VTEKYNHNAVNTIAVPGKSHGENANTQANAFFF
jgi:hypothetical protein